MRNEVIGKEGTVKETEYSTFCLSVHRVLTNIDDHELAALTGKIFLFSSCCFGFFLFFF